MYASKRLDERHKARAPSLLWEEENAVTRGAGSTFDLRSRSQIARARLYAAARRLRPRRSSQMRVHAFPRLSLARS